jgi:hypothetical protein
VNSQIYGNTVPFPEQMRNHLMNSMRRVQGVNKDSEGYKRNEELQKQDKVTYQQLKRIKNFFDNFKGNPNDPSFILNGGNEMKSWVNVNLNQMRMSPEMTKKNKMETGMENQFIKTHEKDSIDVRKSKEHKSTLGKYDVQVTEALKRINEIISKI